MYWMIDRKGDKSTVGERNAGQRSLQLKLKSQWAFHANWESAACNNQVLLYLNKVIFRPFIVFCWKTGGWWLDVSTISLCMTMQCHRAVIEIQLIATHDAPDCWFSIRFLLRPHAHGCFLDLHQIDPKCNPITYCSVTLYIHVSLT